MGHAIPFQENFQSVAALGRSFKVGDLYAYHHSKIRTYNTSYVYNLFFF